MERSLSPCSLRIRLLQGKSAGCGDFLCLGANSLRLGAVLPCHRAREAAHEKVGLPVLEDAPEGDGVGEDLGRGKHADGRRYASVGIAHRDPDAHLTYVEREDPH